MLHRDIVIEVAVDRSEGYKYVVILDMSKMDTPEEQNPKYGKIALRTNNYDKAVQTANFWDERCNTHFIEVNAPTLDEYRKLTLRKRTLQQLATNNMETVTGTDTDEYFNALSPHNKLLLRVAAAESRI